MKTKFRTDGDPAAFIYADVEPQYHDIVMGLYYQPSDEGFAKHFPANTPHLPEIYQRFALHAEEMVLQTAYERPVPWKEALEAFAEVAESGGIRWRLAGSAALAIRGIDVLPRDLDLVTDNAGAQKLGDLLSDYLVEPVLSTSGWVANWFGRAFLHMRVEWIGVDDPYAAEGLETVYWRGEPIQAPSLEMQLEEDRQRGLTERVEKIERYLIDRRA